MSARVRPSYEIIEVDSDELLQACYNVRIEVFVHEQGFDLADEIDDYDPVARHFALIVTESDAKKLVGTIRVVPEKGKVGRLAILKQYRSFGFGNDLVQAVKKWAIEERAKSSAIPNELVLHSQLYVIPFYEKNGYRKIEGVFDEDGAPHVKMVCPLTQT